MISRLAVLFSHVLFFPMYFVKLCQNVIFFYLCIFLYYFFLLFFFMFIHMLPLSVCDVHCYWLCVCVCCTFVYGRCVYLSVCCWVCVCCFWVFWISVLLMFIFLSMVGAFYGQSLFEQNKHIFHCKKKKRQKITRFSVLVGFWCLNDLLLFLSFSFLF